MCGGEPEPGAQQACLLRHPAHEDMHRSACALCTAGKDRERFAMPGLAVDLSFRRQDHIACLKPLIDAQGIENVVRTRYDRGAAEGRESCSGAARRSRPRIISRHDALFPGEDRFVLPHRRIQELDLVTRCSFLGREQNRGPSWTAQGNVNVCQGGNGRVTDRRVDPAPVDSMQSSEVNPSVGQFLTVHIKKANSQRTCDASASVVRCASAEPDENPAMARIEHVAEQFPRAERRCVERIIFLGPDQPKPRRLSDLDDRSDTIPQYPPSCLRQPIMDRSRDHGFVISPAGILHKTLEGAVTSVRDRTADDCRSGRNGGCHHFGRFEWGK